MSPINELEARVIKETPRAFSKQVIDLVWEKDISYFEALNKLMQEKNYEPEYVAKLVTPDLKSFLTEEAGKLALIKKENRLDF